jgi:hypothetical protein
MRRGRATEVVNEGDDTLTESCKGAISFMVIEISFGSLQKIRVGEVVEDGRSWDGLRQRVVPQVGFFVFLSKRWGSAELIVSTSQKGICDVFRCWYTIASADNCVGLGESEHQKLCTLREITQPPHSRRLTN